VGLGMIGMAILTWSEGDEGIIRWQWGSTIAGFGMLVIGYWFGSALIRPGIAYFQARPKRDSRCAACGHSWEEWVDGTPMPTAHTALDALAPKPAAPEPPAQEPPGGAP
jgi:hypothetical protein